MPAPSAPCLYVLCGLPFAGKSTLAVSLTRKLGIPCVELDSINSERGLGGEPISPEQWEETYGESYRRTRHLLGTGNDILYDAANFTRVERDTLRGIAASVGASVRLIYVYVTPEEATARLRRNRSTRLRKDVRDDDFALVLNAFEPPLADEDAMIYNGDIPAAEWIEANFYERTIGQD